MCGGNILGYAVCPDTMHLQFSKPECQQRVCSFRRVSISPIAAIQLVANICVHSIGGPHTNTAIADEPSFCWQDNGPLKLVARLLFTPGDECLHEMTNISL